MGLSHGRLANIDRRVFAELDRTDGIQTVKVPVSGALWSTWRRYSQAIGLSMGEGVAGLIARELDTVVNDSALAGPVFGDPAELHASERAKLLEARERDIVSREASLRARERQLRVWEQSIRDREQESTPGVPKVGRNERCPCGSGVKYKHCHGS